MMPVDSGAVLSTATASPHIDKIRAKKSRGAYSSAFSFALHSPFTVASMTECTKTGLKEFRKKLNFGERFENFDRAVFGSAVEKSIAGGYNEKRSGEPLKITFVYKTGIHSDFSAKTLRQSVKMLRLYRIC